MLLATTTALESEPDSHAAWHWPGPRVLLDLPGSGLGPQRVDGMARTLGPDTIVIEFLSDAGPGSVATGTAAHLLAEVMGLLAPHIADADWPLLYLAAPAGREAVLAHARHAGDHPDGFSASLSAGGSLTALWLGERIAGSPLLSECLSVARERAVDDRLLVALLRQAFGTAGS